MIFVFKLINLFGLCFFASHTDASQGCQKCLPTDPNKINVHLIPHTHDDVGWLKTADQYYYGSNKQHAQPGVQYILDSVISELDKNPNHRFVYVETAYFWAWWNELDDGDKGKQMVRRLVESGQLEFLHGGWCMSDEATPHYTAMIDQMTFGLKFLNETFGVCGRPTVSWQIDPFGHSSEVAIEFAEMGFNALFVGRIDYQDHERRKSSKNLETVWRPDPTLGEAGDLFTSVLFDLYTAPAGFCFDTYCNDEPIMDNRRLHGYNVDEKIKKFEEHIQRYEEAYKTKHVLVTMGSDFTYTAAASWYRNIDKLIKYTNLKNPKLNLLYSTPSCYVNAINSLNLTWQTKESDDYFPYGSDEHSYWTGYYTSRAAFKYYVYLVNNILQATKQLATVLDKYTLLQTEEEDAKRAVAISQHHDGVSGTEKQHVADDYAVYLTEGLNASRILITESYRRLYNSAEYPAQSFGNLRNISAFNISEENHNFIISIYNPSTQKKLVPVKFPLLKDSYYEVFNKNGTPVEHDLIPIPASLHQLPGRTSKATQDMVFIAELPPHTVTNYFAQASQAIPVDAVSTLPPTPVNDSIIILDNGKIKLTFNKTDGLLQSVTKNGNTWPFRQNFYAYNAMKGYNYNAESRASGAYIFRPVPGEPNELFKTANITQYQGKNVFEIHQKFSDWISQVVRLYKDSEDIEFEWLIGEIPINDWTGLEVITKYKTDIASNSTFYTDSNGRRWMKRIRNYRKYWDLQSQENVSCNYYPLTTGIHIKDNVKQVTVIVDRPEGGTSMKDGEMEIMLHRRLLYDDNKGVIEPLDETAFGRGLVVRGKHVVQINSIAAAADAYRFKAVESAFNSVPTFAKTNLTLDDWRSKFGSSRSLLKNEQVLPPSVQILTLERWRQNQILLRLEHIFQAGESNTHSQPVTINIKAIFSHFTVLNYQELTLAANLEKDKLKRLKWSYDGSTTKKSDQNSNGSDLVTLQPMQIKTFLLFVSYN